MRLLVLLAVISCQVEQRYTVTTVPTAELRAALAKPTIAVDTTVVLPAEPPLAALATRIDTLAAQCKDSTRCPLDQRLGPASLRTTRSVRRPNWKAVGVVAVIAAVNAAVVTGEVYCFADCSTAGKITLGAVDVLALGAAAVGVTLAGAMLKMNN
jgi:hypothetical protein